MLTEPILAPDAAGRHVRPGSKVVIELTSYPGDNPDGPNRGQRRPASSPMCWAPPARRTST